MRQEGQAFMIVLVVAFFCVFATGVARAEKKMPDTAVLKLEGAKLGPVTFSHITHSGKAKIRLRCLSSQRQKSKRAGQV